MLEARLDFYQRKAEELETYLEAVKLAPGWTGPATVLRAGVAYNRSQIDLIEKMVEEDG